MKKLVDLIVEIVPQCKTPRKERYEFLTTSSYKSCVKKTVVL